MNKYVIGSINPDFGRLGRTFEVPADDNSLWSCMLDVMRENGENHEVIAEAFKFFIERAGSVFNGEFNTYFVGVLEQF